MFAFARSEPILDTATGPERSDRSHEQLARIAAALDLPAQAFHEQPTTCGDACEALELLRLLGMITDPARRRASLAFVRAAAKRNKISKA